MILVTGANGFVGSALVSTLASLAKPTRASCRGNTIQAGIDIETVTGIDLTASSNFDQLLDGISVVIHTAARVHVMDDRIDNPLSAYRAVNVDGTKRLAQQAAQHGVKRFIFFSSIKVNGERTSEGQAFTADMIPAPTDAYAQSKLEAENALLKIAESTGMEVVIIRLPLVYGPGVKANFARMIRWVSSGFPLPLGSINANSRSMVGLDNLIDLVLICTTHRAAANQIFLVSDDEDLSTAALLRRLAKAMGKPAYLLPIPLSILRLGAKLIGQAQSMRRLTDSLQVDIAKTKQMLAWQPPTSVDESLRRAVTKVI